jgi:hypothetical protein
VRIDSLKSTPWRTTPHPVISTEAHQHWQSQPTCNYLSLAIADPLSELEQKTDSLCLPNLELMMFALACVAQPIADPFSGLANAVDSNLFLIGSLLSWLLAASKV